MISDLETGFISPVLVAVTIDSSGRVVDRLPGLCAEYFKSCGDVLSRVLDALNVPTELRLRKGLVDVFGDVSPLFTGAASSESGSSEKLVKQVEVTEGDLCSQKVEDQVTKSIRTWLEVLQHKLSLFSAADESASRTHYSSEVVVSMQSLSSFEM